MLWSFQYGMSHHLSMNHLYPRMLYAKFVCYLPDGCGEDFSLLYFCYFAIISPGTKDVWLNWSGGSGAEDKNENSLQ